MTFPCITPDDTLQTAVHKLKPSLSLYVNDKDNTLPDAVKTYFTDVLAHYIKGVPVTCFLLHKRVLLGSFKGLGRGVLMDFLEAADSTPDKLQSLTAYHDVYEKRYFIEAQLG